MATPKLSDFLRYGPGAFEAARKREEKKVAEELAPTLLELKNVAGQPTKEYVDPNGYNVNLPSAKFDSVDQLDLTRALNTIGIDEKQLNATRQTDKLNRAIDNLSSPEQRVDALNKKSVAPVGFNGGTAYNRLNTNSPIIDSTDAIKSLARLRDAKAGEQTLRNEALQSILDNPEIDPLTMATVANKGSTFKPQRVKVRRMDGKQVYMDATPQIGGGFSYTPANDQKGNPLIVPPSPSSVSPIEKDAELFERVLGMDKKSSTRLSLSLRQHLKTARPDEAWSKLVSEISKMQFNRYAKDPKRLYEKAAEIWSVKFPNRPIPNRDLLESTLLPKKTAIPDNATPQSEAKVTNEQVPQLEVRARAQKEGYEIIGDWVEGKGFLVRNTQGQKGYFY